MKGAKRKPHSTSLILLLICIFAFWWGISLLVQPIPSSNEPTAAQTQALPQTQAQAPVIVHETVSGATRTYSGVFNPKSACDSFGSGIRYSAANGGHVSVLLITEPSPTACAQAEGTASSGEPFSVSIKLSVNSAPTFDGVLLNGSQIPAQLQMGN